LRRITCHYHHNILSPSVFHPIIIGMNKEIMR
jgi:hypothetical protein